MQGCTDTNTGFDGLGYQPVWPDGNRRLHPTPFLFTSPRTGTGFDQPYERVAFEADLPRIEPNLQPDTGAGCTLIPTTDTGTPAAFYPFFSTFRTARSCIWPVRQRHARAKTNFGRNAQYGTLLPLPTSPSEEAAHHQPFNNFRQIIANPC